MRQPPNFGEQTFLEVLSRAAPEKVYSAAFAWVLGERSPLPLEGRLAIVASLFGVDTAGAQSIEADTEWRKIDLLLTIKKGNEDLCAVAIENKIKALEGKNQLHVYDDVLAKEIRAPVRKIFLTLSGENPQSGKGWRPVPYAKLLDVLSAESPSDGNLSDLCHSLARLVGAAEQVRNSPDLATAVFRKNGSPPKVWEKVYTYIKYMRLEVVMQRIWFMELAKKLDAPNPWLAITADDNGSACFDIKALHKDKPKYGVGIQIQNNAFKVYCYPDDTYRKTKATESQRADVEEILLKMKYLLAPNSNQELSKDRGMGFRSFSFPGVSLEGMDRNIDRWIEVIKPRLVQLYEAAPPVIRRDSSSGPP